LRYQRAQAEAVAGRAALSELEKIGRTQATEPGVLAELRQGYEARIALADERIRALHLDHAVLEGEERRRLQRHLMLVEKERVLQAIHEGLSS
jgi:hypothetical protein